MLQAESEYRHALLLKRAQQKSGTDESSRKGIAAVDNVAIEAAHELVKGELPSNPSHIYSHNPHSA